MSIHKHPFVVKKRISGYNGNDTYIVVKNPGQSRVSATAFPSRESAQHSADELNIGHMVKDYADDPRPYAERLAEATATYREEAK